ncbi:hypothetical protein MLD38_036462 [Melastoma candidum]|uniref:Uncharacterized protein n=1 Tax=Melastoma candidum TaxID=119954 RepID=A0ACB9LJ98_9MYRT|nr:hypothetical protein MLD38_036462 [Melastoma candidum]
MALLEAVFSAELINFLMYDDPLFSSTLTAAMPPLATSHDSSDTTLIPESHHHEGQPLEEEVLEEEVKEEPKVVTRRRKTRDKAVMSWNALGPHQGTRKKRKRRPKECKNKEEAENQRMTHIAVERNRRRQMNEHLAVLRSLMPESHVQRGDQASIVGGAVEFVKELEHLLQNLEAQKLRLSRTGGNPKSPNPNFNNSNNDDNDEEEEQGQPPFSCFFMCPRISRSRASDNALPSTSSITDHAVADIEVTLIETHANMRILSRRNPRNLSKLVSGFHALQLTILHLSLATLETMVLYSISAKVEEGCQLTSVDGIAGAVHHMLRIIDEVK